MTVPAAKCAICGASVPFDESPHNTCYCSLRCIEIGLAKNRDSDGTPTGAINEDLSVLKDCQARAESIAQNTPS